MNTAIIARSGVDPADRSIKPMSVERWVCEALRDSSNDDQQARGA
jgi:hypothetical protein